LKLKCDILAFVCRYVAVGRELSVREIAAVREGTETEVEAFVHGGAVQVESTCDP
jgi:collagenase-like PrtC family protease